MQERTPGARALFDQLAASAHAIKAEFPYDLNGRPPYAHSVPEENAWTIEQFITLAVSDGRSAIGAIDAMRVDCLPWG